MVVKKTPEEVNAEFGDHNQNENLIQKRYLHA